jgi:glycosyltransferase involved in cell wall biosynthesis
MADRHLFIAGCPRSGTSALAFLLNEHPCVALGFERFKRVRAQLDPFHFTPAQFFSPVLAETDIRGQLLYERLRRRWQGGAVRVVGDKVPLYTRVLPQLLARFPHARVAVLVRDPLDVARSFSRRAADPEDWWPAENDHRLAIRMWNEALASVRAVDGAREADGKEEEERVALLAYEALFSGEERWLELLLAFAGLPRSARLQAEHRRLAEEWEDALRRRAGTARAVEEDLAAKEGGLAAGDGLAVGGGGLAEYVRTHVDGELARWARERMERQLRLSGRPEQPPAGADEPALTAREIGERERERAQLLEEMRHPGRREADELEVLERRFVEQAGEMARRGELAGGRARRGEPFVEPPPRRDGPSAEPARHGGRGCAPRGGAEARVTFIVPHQRASTGGVYVIEQFARHLARDARVCVAVRGEPTRPISGVEVRRLERLHADALPPADVLVYPADMRDGAGVFELPARAGRPVMLFQGYGTPGSPVVEANLACAREAVAIAHWLADLARTRGVPCAYVPQGLDREVFAPGAVAPAQRAPRLSLMTHRLDWKGLADALEALAVVRARRPDVEVTLFGTEPVSEQGTFVARPTRPQVAALLRESAVYVLASWEEGFGLTGAEAIACGAALASTDTKGSRDYAIDGHTALVSAPRDPQALARNVLALLADAPLRTRLVSAGQRHLRTAMPPWEEAARRMRLALLED